MADATIINAVDHSPHTVADTMAGDALTAVRPCPHRLALWGIGTAFLKME
jgi:hypothetical protein